eukprot:GILJ01009443.1.p1 GENE.GILJ01009443.1~~GILJ01009443.1.p1  ORF type:complete len:255 (-),score=20.40 GILJ01009443.1:195-959(-)
MALSRTCSLRSSNVFFRSKLPSMAIARRQFSVIDRLADSFDYEKKREKELQRYLDKYKNDFRINWREATSNKKPMAGNQPFKASTSIEFPAFVADSLPGKKTTFPDCLRGKVSLVLIWCRGTLEDELNSYYNPFKETFGSEPKAQLLEVNWDDGRLARWAHNFISRNFRMDLLPERKASELCYYGDFDHVKERLFLHNRFVVHAFLVDQQARVRWRALKDARPQEVEALINITKKLLHEPTSIAPPSRVAPKQS